MSRNDTEHKSRLQFRSVAPHGFEKMAAVTSVFQCAGCGEWNETTVDSSVGMKQQYVEDCQVCCKPNVLLVTWDMSSGEYTIQAELE